jgi:hypothetical protein
MDAAVADDDRLACCGRPAASFFSAGVNVAHSTVPPGVKWRRRTAGDFSGMLPKYHRIQFTGLLMCNVQSMARWP